MDIIQHTYNNSLGDLFQDWRDSRDLKEQERKSALKDAEVQRKLNEQLLSQLSQRKAMYSGDKSSSNSKYIILGGVAAIAVVSLIIFT